MNTVTQDAHFANLSNDDWHVVISTWCRGSDWCVSQVQDWFEVSGAFGTWPRFTTEDDALEALDGAILAEARRRAAAS